MRHTATYAPGYRGARFFKSDLQMSTPADRERWEDSTNSIEALGSVTAAAEAFIRACYAEGLELIAITDHNFASKAFISELNAAVDRLHGELGWTLVILPGFEVMADVGKGVHVLGIFERGTDLEEIDHKLTECGIPPPRFVGGVPASSRERLPEILAVVQERLGDGQLKGLVILPHALSDAGIFDSGHVADWLQQSEYLNPSLFCLEVPKPVADMSPGWQKLLRSGDDCDLPWRRRRSIATVMSSDSKALTASSGSTNYVGRRYTWIKMSVPSIESLRQAFLDHESRIRLSKEPPEDALDFPRLQAVRIRGARFLEDLQVALSPNLNAIIGGGGTGKSTLIEYARIALNQESAIYGAEARRNLDRIKQTISDDTVIEVDVWRDGESWTLRSTGGRPPDVLAGKPIPDIAKFFPVRFVSQREVYAIAEDRGARMSLLDNLIRGGLSALQRQKDDATRQIRALNDSAREIPTHVGRLKELRTELLDLESRKSALHELETPLREWRRFVTEEQGLLGAQERGRELAAAVRDALEAIRWRDASDQTEFFKTLSSREAAALGRLKDSVADALNEFEKSLDGLQTQDEREAWQRSYDSARTAYEELRSRITGDAEADAEAYLRLDSEITDRSDQIQQSELRISELKEEVATREGLVAQLRDLWRQETQLRIEKAVRLQAAVPRTAGGAPFVEVSVEAFGDDEALVRLLEKYRADGRRISEEDWSEFLEALSRAAPDGASPLELLRPWIRTLRKRELPEGFPWQKYDRRIGVLLEWIRDEELAEIDLVRVPDRVVVRLNRNDGTPAGELEHGLSVGQKCTAILALLLAEDSAPAVIDQPEEDIDNEFTYRHLVPLLRQAKESRQLVVATHDPNIPVNGDAELIVPLEAKDGRGRLKIVEGQLAVGALDQVAVRHAVEEIMEGSEDAFRRRFEKYGF
jgi:energy-coupling factor transporter ATP-binding protein EcfA2